MPRRRRDRRSLIFKPFSPTAETDSLVETKWESNYVIADGFIFDQARRLPVLLAF